MRPGFKTWERDGRPFPCFSTKKSRLSILALIVCVCYTADAFVDTSWRPSGRHGRHGRRAPIAEPSNRQSGCLASGGEGAARRQSPPRPPRNNPSHGSKGNALAPGCPGTRWGEGGITAQQAEGMTSEATAEARKPAAGSRLGRRPRPLLYEGPSRPPHQPLYEQRECNAALPRPLKPEWNEDNVWRGRVIAADRPKGR